MLSILFPNRAPQFAGYQFEATLEDTFEASIELTSYPVESGVQVNDHRIINPQKWFVTGAIGSNPLKPLIEFSGDISDLYGVAIGAATNLFRKNPLIAAAAGLATGFLAGNKETQASATLEFLLQLMRSGMPFDVDAVDVQLKNMVITKISRTRTPENERGLIVVLELQELIMRPRLSNTENTEPDATDLIDSDPSQTSCSAAHYRGQQAGKEKVDVATATAVRQSVIQPYDLAPL